MKKHSFFSFGNGLVRVSSASRFDINAVFYLVLSRRSSVKGVCLRRFQSVLLLLAALVAAAAADESRHFSEGVKFRAFFICKFPMLLYDGAFIVCHFNILNLFIFKLGNYWLKYYRPLVDANSALV